MLLINCTEEVGNRVLDCLRNELVPLAMKQSIPAGDLVLLLKAEEKSVSNRCLQRTTSPRERPILILDDPSKSAQQPDQRVFGGIPVQVGKFWRTIMTAAANMDVGAGALAGTWIASPYEQEIVLVLNLHTKPRNVLSYDALGDITLGAAETIVENIYDGGLAGLRSTSKNIKTCTSKCNCPALTTNTIDANGANGETHRRIPHAARIVGVSPAAANQRAIFRMASTVSRTSVVVSSSADCVNEARLEPVVTTPPLPMQIA